MIFKSSLKQYRHAREGGHLARGKATFIKALRATRPRPSAGWCINNFRFFYIPSRRKTESGNALFLVLIGVALLAALGFSVMRTGRTSGSMTQENIAFAGNAIMRYADDVHNAVQIVAMAGNDVSTLSFENNTIAGYANASAPASGASKVFSAAGGGMPYKAPDTAWLDTAQSAKPFYGQWYFPRNVCVPFVGMGGDGVTNGSAALCNADSVDNEETLIVLPYVNANICKYIDKKIGITLCSNAACAATADLLPALSDKFTGTFSESFAFYASTGSSAFNRQYEGCIQGTGATAGVYFYYKVLFER